MGGEEKPPDRREERRRRLEWKDYVALVIASLQTVLLPFVILLFVMVLLGIIIHVLTLR
jgi:hypothetical protein